MQSCVLCLFVRCGTCKQIEKKEEKKRYKQFFKLGNPKTTESVGYLGPKIWNILPETLQNATSLQEFKQNVKTWAPDNCPCRLCRTYIPNLGFLD